jgi:hypothetical protein
MIRFYIASILLVVLIGGPLIYFSPNLPDHD